MLGLTKQRTGELDCHPRGGKATTPDPAATDQMGAPAILANLPCAAQAPAKVPSQPRAPQLERNPTLLRVKYDGDSQQLWFFLKHVLTYM